MGESTGVVGRIVLTCVELSVSWLHTVPEESCLKENLISVLLLKPKGSFWLWVPCGDSHEEAG